MNVLTTEEIEKRISDSYELPNNVLDAVPEPLVTIRTSTYNHGPYIRQCIEGVLMQKTNFPFEFIIGEDYSTDETRDIVFEYAKKYPDIIRVITADYNVGSKANGRRCIRACRGKYMALCEGDDYWIDPLKLQKQVDLLENDISIGMVNTDVDVLYQESNYYLRNYNKSKRLSNNKYVSGNVPIEVLLNSQYLIKTPTVLIRKKLFDNYLKSEECTYIREHFPMGDTPIWVFFAKESKIFYLDEVTTVYRRNKGSASNQINFRNKLYFSLLSAELKIFYIEKYKIKDDSFVKFAYKLYENNLLSYLSFVPDYNYTYKLNNKIEDRINKLRRNLFIRLFYRIKYYVHNILFFMIQDSYYYFRKFF